MYNNKINKNNGLSVLNGTLYAVSNLIFQRLLWGQIQVYSFKHQALACGHIGVESLYHKGQKLFSKHTQWLANAAPTTATNPSEEVGTWPNLVFFAYLQACWHFVTPIPVCIFTHVKQM